MTSHGGEVCGAWRRDANACDAPAGLGTSHPGYGRCREHFGETPKGRGRAAELEAVAKAEHVAKLMGFPIALDAPPELLGLVRVYTELLSAVRIYSGALAYCERRLAETRYDADWVHARAALVEKWLKSCRKAERAGVDMRDGREITPEVLERHLEAIEEESSP